MENKFLSTVGEPLSPALWRTVLDQSVSGIIVYEAVRRMNGTIDTFRVVLANQRAEQLLGLSQADMLGQLVTDLFPASLSSNLWRDAARVLDTGEPIQQEQFYALSRSPFGGWFNVRIAPLGDGQSIVISFIDITDLKKAQQALLGDSLLFKALSSTVPEVGVVVFDYFQKITIASGAIPGLFAQQSPNELIGRRMQETILPEFREDWDAYIRTALAGEQHFFSDHWGGWRAEVYVGPVRNDQGEVVMGLAVYRNVTEQYRQQLALQRINNELKRSNESLEQFAYVASHDLQEPLRKIRSFGEILEKRYAEAIDDTGRDMLRRMEGAADRMSELIRSLLSYARMAQQQSFGLVNLIDLLDGIRNDLELVIQEKNAVVDVKTHLPLVPGDELQLRQLFQNLLTNALKFTRPDTEPRISVDGRLVQGSDIPNSDPGEAGEQFAEITVSDNGIGIAPENYNRIFGLFNRLHGRQQYAGTGIGLAIVRKVVDNHNGSLIVDSEVGRGTTFRIYLPLNIPAVQVED